MVKTKSIYVITLNNRSDKYMATAKSGVNGNYTVFEFRRVRTPKSKIDAVRLPETIHIRYFGESADALLAELEKSHQ